MDRDQLLELAPHYVANLVLIYLAIIAVRVLVGNVGLFVELGVVAVVVLLYPTVVRALGVAPEMWER